MTIRTEIEAHALVAAKQIHKAAAEFAAATGLELHADIRYISYRFLGDEGARIAVDRVTVEAAGVQVGA